MALFLLGLILSIPAAIVANILTPKVRSWYASRSLNNRQRKIERIQNELKSISDLRNGPVAEMTAYCTRLIIGTIGNFSFAVIFNVSFVAADTNSKALGKPFSAIVGLMGVITLWVAAYAGLKVQGRLMKIYKFSRYEVKVNRQLQELQRSSADSGLDSGDDTLAV